MPIQVGEKGIEMEFEWHDLALAMYYLYDAREII